jgi:hypothetical protein
MNPSPPIHDVARDFNVIFVAFFALFLRPKQLFLFAVVGPLGQSFKGRRATTIRII